MRLLELKAFEDKLPIKMVKRSFTLSFFRKKSRHNKPFAVA